MNLEKLKAIMKRNQANRHKYRKKRVAELRKFWNNYKLERGCYVCGYKKCAESLHFHHRNPVEKVNSICRLIQACTGMQKIENEVIKCDIICANCHGELHGE